MARRATDTATASHDGPSRSGDIAKVVHEATPQIRRCYQQELVARPALTGKSKISFTVGPAGRVVSVTVELGFDTNVDACVAKVLRGLTFPASVTGESTTVTYPFVFVQQR